MDALVCVYVKQEDLDVASHHLTKVADNLTNFLMAVALSLIKLQRGKAQRVALGVLLKAEEMLQDDFRSLVSTR